MFTVEDFVLMTHQPSEARPVLGAQAMELRSRFALAQDFVSVDPVPGDLVQEKRGLGVKIMPYRKIELMIVWRYLDLTDWTDRLLVRKWMKEVGGDKYDCLTAEMTDDGTSLVFRPNQLSHLELWRES
jgi:hypothetical protein